MVKQALLSALVTLAVSLPASAQTVTVPVRLGVGCGFDHEKAVENLTRFYQTGDQAAFRTHAVAVIKALAAKPGADCPEVKEAGIDPERHTVLLLWVAPDPQGKGDAVFRAVIYKRDDDIFSPTLPGISGADPAYEIFLSKGARDAVASAYVSTRERDPLESQLPALAQAILDPLLTLLASTQGTLSLRGMAVPPPNAPPPPPPGYYATVSRLTLPYARATVKVDVRVAMPIGKGAIEAAAAGLHERNAFTTGAHAACALTLNTELKREVQAAAATCATRPGTCAAALTPTFKTAYDTAIGGCLNEPELKEFNAVDASYRQLVTGFGAARVAGTFDLKNSPRRLASLGIMTGYAFGGSVKEGPRVKLDAGKFVADPLPRRLSLVVVNMGFRRYNAEAFHPTKAERYRWFAGAIVTPDFGVAVGASALLVRGLSANAGIGVLGVRRMHEGGVLGQAPTNGEDPLRMGHANVAFLGVGYNFK
jgi:hypothetical protein